jgi:hypothetical protein
MSRYLIAALLVAALGCSPPSRTPGLLGGAVFELDEARKSLVIPPDEEALEAARQIGGQAATGDPRAAWAEIHYLVDLFDAARFEPDAETRDRNRRGLLEILDIADGSGATTTNLAIDAILVKVDRLLGADRLHAGAQAARTLLEHDRSPTPPAELFRHMLGLKKIARGDGPLAANATLRLADFCRVSFRDAAAAATPFRPGILSFCLYSLYDSDPAPYFGADPGKRPPEPRWQDLAEGTLALYAQVGKTSSRVAKLGPALGGRLRAFIDEKKGLWPTSRAPGELGAPMVAAAAPYEWTPLVLLGDGGKPPSPDLPNVLAKLLAVDRRGRVAVALTSTAPATATLAAAEAARQGGADALELVVGYEQTLRAPSGDYWHGKISGDKVARLGVVVVALDTTPESEGVGPAPRSHFWDAARAGLGLHLVIGQAEWQLVSPSGALPAIPATSVADAATALVAQLAQVRAAFPDEDGVVLVPEAGASYGALVAAAVATRQGAGFTMLALEPRRPPVTGKPTLPARVALRASAKVTVVPDALASRAGAVRQCYQDALERDGKLAGTLGLELVAAGETRTAVVTSGPKDKALRTCVTQSLSPAMLQGNVKNARVTLERVK